MAEQATTDSRPNIVLIMVDDMGFSDIGCFGSEIKTPSIDALAENGATFTHFYNYARCCPTRASLLTGLYPHQAGIGHMTLDLEAVGYRGFINRECVTIAEALKGGGYTTLMSGKWHVGGDYLLSATNEAHPGEEKWPIPVQRGFDRHIGTLTGAGSFWNPHTMVDGDKPIQAEGDDFYYTDFIADNAVDFIGEHGVKDNPFFLYVAFTAPHWPLHAFDEDIEKYRGQYRDGWDKLRTSRHEELKGSGIVDSKWDISPRDESAPPWEDVKDTDWEDARMAVYAAQIDRMDQGIGRIMARLEAMDLKDNTLVMFLSDNGGCAEFLKEDGRVEVAPTETRDGRPVRVGNHRDLMPGPDDTYLSYDLPWANASNTPFKLFKHWTHEGGIATPFIAHWPAGIAAGQRVTSPAHLIDVMATCVDVADTPYPSEYDGNAIQPLQGESFRPAFSDDQWSREREIFWEHEGNLAVRQGNWKLVRKFPGDWELYDMDEDRTELDDLAGKLPDKIAELRGLYDNWAANSRVIPWDEILDLPKMAPTKLRLYSTLAYKK
ncbi:MAG: arylsulfatase [Chloroflexota bacterium]|nr:arylsulfatase [Chloroflexota bacterium]